MNALRLIPLARLQKRVGRESTNFGFSHSGRESFIATLCKSDSTVGWKLPAHSDRAHESKHVSQATGPHAWSRVRVPSLLPASIIRNLLVVPRQNYASSVRKNTDGPSGTYEPHLRKILSRQINDDREAVSAIPIENGQRGNAGLAT